jgi:hypothetical protein
LTGWTAAILATLVTLALVAGELTSAGQRRWWGDRPLTTDTVSGLLVLLITVLVVNQLLKRRQSRQRGHAIGAQAAILVAQAGRSAKATASVLGGSGDRDAASDGFRTYMMMLLTSAPVLMNDPVARHFLEQSQYLGGVMARALAAVDSPPNRATGPDGGFDGMLNDAMRQVQSAAAPLLRKLTPAVSDAIQRIGQTAEE